MNEEIALNIGAGEKLIGVEALNAKEALGSGKIPDVSPEGLPAPALASAVQEKPSKKYSA